MLKIEGHTWPMHAPGLSKYTYRLETVVQVTFCKVM